MNLKVNDKIFVLNNDSGAVIKEVLYSEHAGGHVYVVEFEDGTTGNFFAGDLKKVDDVHFEI